jgi:transcriptional regulator with XRE-family HTH domain
MPTAGQIRAARGLLGWTMATLAARAGVSAATVARCERGAGVPRVTIRTIEAVRDALVAGGIEFLQNANGTGVRPRRR